MYTDIHKGRKWEKLLHINGYVLLKEWNSMPKFGSVLSSLQAKLEEARVSNLNYELGRFVQDTKCYLSSTFKGPGNSLSGIPKSTSLPVFPAGYNKR